MENPIKMDDLGGKTPIFENTQMDAWMFPSFWDKPSSPPIASPGKIPERLSCTQPSTPYKMSRNWKESGMEEKTPTNTVVFSRDMYIYVYIQR